MSAHSDSAAITAAEMAEALRERYDRSDPLARPAIEGALNQYQFYHTIDVIPGLATRGMPSRGPDWAWAQTIIDRLMVALSQLDVKGKRVLDIGCRDGALSFAAERLGAAEVIGIDNDLSPGLTEFLIPFKRSRVRAVQLNINDLTPKRFGQFDVVLFAGVLYHLRYPMWALKRIADVLRPGGTLLIEGAFLDGLDDLPVIFCPYNVPHLYEHTCVTFFNDAGLAATLASLGFSPPRRVDAFLYSGRRYALAFPRFLRRNWWRVPRVCRKIFISSKIEEAEKPYWDGAHAYHSTGVVTASHSTMTTPGAPPDA